VRHVVIVGATDGIGLALAQAFGERSWRVGLVGRDREKVIEQVRRIREACPGTEVVGGVLDVTDRDAVVPTLEGVLSELGQMDLLVYCAGVMERGDEGTRHMLAVNFLGAVDVAEWAAGHFTDAGGGRLAALGAVAGDRGRKGNAVYAASKAALHAYLEALRHRLHPHGVGVSTIKPGWVRTRMLGPVPSFPPAVSAERAADIIVRRLDSGRDVFYVPAWWRLVSTALRLLPTFVFKRLAP
jgi:NAD(P)-dependent dehydrogenase (short-subunit alcohol dehydrogenase family)